MRCQKRLHAMATKPQRETESEAHWRLLSKTQLDGDAAVKQEREINSKENEIKSKEKEIKSKEKEIKSKEAKLHAMSKRLHVMATKLQRKTESEPHWWLLLNNTTQLNDAIAFWSPVERFKAALKVKGDVLHPNFGVLKLFRVISTMLKIHIKQFIGEPHKPPLLEVHLDELRTTVLKLCEIAGNEGADVDGNGSGARVLMETSTVLNEDGTDLKATLSRREAWAALKYLGMPILGQSPCITKLIVDVAIMLLGHHIVCCRSFYYH